MSMRHLHKNLRQNSGYTLIELMIIMIVVGILGYLSLGSLNYYVVRQAQQQAHNQTIVNITDNLVNYATVLQIASHTLSNNQFNSTLTITQYNQIANSVSSSLLIDTTLQTSNTISLYFNHSGLAQVVNSSKTVGAKHFITQKKWHDY